MITATCWRCCGEGWFAGQAKVCLRKAAGGQSKGVVRAQAGSLLFGQAELGRGVGSSSAGWWGLLVVVAGWLVFLGCFFCFLTPCWAGCWFWLPLFFFKLGGLLPPAHPRRPASGTGAHPHPVRAVAVGVGAVARDLRRPQCGPPRGRQPHLSLSTYKRGARGGERGRWEVVEKEGKKDLGKVVTGGGEGTEAEGTEKANHSAA